jgi:hypothetical protein
MSKPDVSPHGLQWLDHREAETDRVLQRLLSEAARSIPGLSPDPSLTDPLVKLLLAAMAREYAAVYGQLDQVIDKAYQQLVDNLLTFPRAAQPSSLVLALDLVDGETSVDEDLVVIGRKAMPDGDTFKERNIHFTPFAAERVPGLAVPVLLHQSTSGSLEVLSDGSAAVVGHVNPGPADWLHIGLTVPPTLDLATVPLFLASVDPALVSALMWSRWGVGQLDAEHSFVPALSNREARWDGQGDPPVMRSRSDRRRPRSPHDRAFVDVPTELLRQGADHLPEAVDVALGQLGPQPPRHWLHVHCHEKVTAANLTRLRVLTNAVVAFNLQADVARFKIGRAPVEAVTLPVGYDQVFRIDEVRDSANVVEFVDAESSAGLGADTVYHLDRDPGGLVRLRLMSRSEPDRPRTIEVMYTTTSGAEANGLAAGSVDTIYNRRTAPGVAGAVSVTSSAGGQAAPGQQWLITELRAHLATRGRAVTARDFEVLARAFDPVRIQRVEVGRGVMRGARGMVSCVKVMAHCQAGSLHGELEREHLAGQLRRYLEARATADQSVAVEILDGG